MERGTTIESMALHRVGFFDRVNCADNRVERGANRVDSYRNRVDSGAAHNTIIGLTILKQTACHIIPPVN